METVKSTRSYQRTWQDEQIKSMRGDIAMLFDVVQQIADIAGYQIDYRLTPSARLRKVTPKVVMSTNAKYPKEEDYDRR